MLKSTIPEQWSGSALLLPHTWEGQECSLPSIACLSQRVGPDNKLREQAQDLQQTMCGGGVSKPLLGDNRQGLSAIWLTNLFQLAVNMLHNQVNGHCVPAPWRGKKITQKKLGGPSAPPAGKQGLAGSPLGTTISARRMVGWMY